MAAILAVLLLVAGALTAGLFGEAWVVDSRTCYAGLGPDGAVDISEPNQPLSYRLVTDAEGFRVPEGSPPLPGRCPLLFLGDSFAEGMYVPAEEAAAAVLEHLLRERGYSVTVHNGGTRGTTLAQARIAALGRWRHLGAEIVVVLQTANDLEDLGRLIKGGCDLLGEPPTEFSSTRSDPLLVAATRAGRAHEEGAPPPRDPGCEAALEPYLALARDLSVRLAAHGTRLVMASVERLWCGDHAVDTGLAETVEASGGAFVDLGDVLHVAGARLRPWDNHPSALGHAQIAARLAAALEARGVLEGCR